MYDLLQNCEQNDDVLSTSPRVGGRGVVSFFGSRGESGRMPRSGVVDDGLYSVTSLDITGRKGLDSREGDVRGLKRMVNED